MTTAFEPVQIEVLDTVTGGMIQHGSPQCRWCKPMPPWDSPTFPSPTFPRPTLPLSPLTI